MNIKTILFVISILFTGCATVLEYDPAILRFDTPETTGKFLAGNAGIIVANTANRVLGSIQSPIFDEDGDKSNIDSPDEYTQSNFTTGYRLDLGILENMDFYLRSLVDTPNIIGTKMQIIGQGRQQNSNGLKMSISAEYGIRGTKNEEDTGDRSTRDMFSYDFSVNVGYRFNKHLITYANHFYNYQYIHGTLDRGTVVYDKEGTSKAFGSLLGIRYAEGHKGPFFGVEYGRSLIKWPKTNIAHNIEKDWVNSYGLNAGYAW